MGKKVLWTVRVMAMPKGPYKTLEIGAGPGWTWHETRQMLGASLRGDQGVRVELYRGGQLLRVLFAKREIMDVRKWDKVEDIIGVLYEEMQKRPGNRG